MRTPAAKRTPLARISALPALRVSCLWLWLGHACSSPAACSAAMSARSSLWPTTPKTCNSREQGGVSVRFASLRALHCRHTREPAWAPWVARISGLGPDWCRHRCQEQRLRRPIRAFRGSRRRGRDARRRPRAGRSRPMASSPAELEEIVALRLQRPPRRHCCFGPPRATHRRLTRRRQGAWSWRRCS
jgi:hypothetical protein